MSTYIVSILVVYFKVNVEGDIFILLVATIQDVDYLQIESTMRALELENPL